MIKMKMNTRKKTFRMMAWIRNTRIQQARIQTLEKEIWMVKDDQQPDLFGKGLSDTTVQGLIASESTEEFLNELSAIPNDFWWVLSRLDRVKLSSQWVLSELSMGSKEFSVSFVEFSVNAIKLLKSSREVSVSSQRVLIEFRGVLVRSFEFSVNPLKALVSSREVLVSSN